MVRLPLLLFALAAAVRAQALPACTGPGLELIHRAAFSVCHSGIHKAPVWTAYRLDREQLHAAASGPVRRFWFRADRALTLPGAEGRDYAGSGFTRGHLVPAADMRFSVAALGDSYLLSNAVPQLASLNSGKWQALERAIRRRAAEAGSAAIYTGAVYCPGSPSIGAGQVAVPCQLYKVVVFGEGPRAEVLGVLMPNGPNPAEPWASFVTTVDAVERMAGIVFPR